MKLIAVPLIFFVYLNYSFGQTAKDTSCYFTVRNFEDSLTINVPHGWQLNFKNKTNSTHLLSCIQSKQIFWIQEDLWYSSTVKDGMAESFYLFEVDSSLATFQELEWLKISFNKQTIELKRGDITFEYHSVNIGHNDIIFYYLQFPWKEKTYMALLPSDANDSAYYQKYFERMVLSIEPI